MSRFQYSTLRRFVAQPAIALCIAAACISGVAYAMRVSPMVVEMTTAGSGSTARVEVQNLNPGNLTFETRITRIDYDADGVQSETPADGDFLVFPPQGVLPQNARQVVRLQWVGGAELPASRAYYLSINQIPVQFAPSTDPNSAGAQVQIVYHIKALVTVAPPKAAPKVEFVSAKPVIIPPKPVPGSTEPPKGAGVPGLAVTVRNTGTRYAMMAGATWTIDGTGADGKSRHLVLAGDALNRDIGAGYLAPLTGVRTFQVATDTPFANAPIKVRFSK